MMKEKFYSLWTTGRGLYVLLGLLFLGIFVSPVLIEDNLISQISVEFVFAMILIAGIFSTPCSIALRVGMLSIACLAVIARTLHKFSENNFAIAGADNILAAFTLVAFSVLIVKHFLLTTYSNCA